MNPASTLRIVRRFPAPRSVLFKAWTDSGELKKWWKLGEGWKLSIVQVDLRVGGRFRIGLEAGGDSTEKHSVTGVYKHVQAPEKLVYTWVVDDPKFQRQESLVTVEFHSRENDSTEIVLTHERLEDRALRDQNSVGWRLVLDGLTRLLENSKV